MVDALALGCWAAAGAQKTLAYGLRWLPAVLLGTITAFGGGFVRDVIMERIPGIVGGNTLYATCALAASAVMVVMYRSGLPAAGSVVATLVGAGLGLLARWRHWVLPQNDSWNAAHALRVRYVRSAQCLGGRDNRRSGQHDAGHHEGTRPGLLVRTCGPASAKTARYDDIVLEVVGSIPTGGLLRDGPLAD